MEADADGATFERADLREAILGGTRLTNSSFRASRLDDADFSDTDLRGADFAFAALSGATRDDQDITLEQLERAGAATSRTRAPEQ